MKFGNCKLYMLGVLFLCFACAIPLWAQTPVGRPRILGISHVGLYTKDLPAESSFWEKLLGFESPYVLPKPSGQTRIAFIKINDQQHIELFNEAPPPDHSFFSHIAFITDNARQMHEYLASRGLQVPQDWGKDGRGGKGKTGDLNFEVRDPDGHLVEFVQYEPGDWRSQHLRRDLPSTRISSRIYHVGFLAIDVNKSEAFYENILGFKNIWQGSANHGRSLSWVNLRVPEGSDYIELMLYDRKPAPDARGGKNHICLLVPHLHQALARLEHRPAFNEYGRTVEAKVGVNGKWQANLFAPNGTRVELMEPETFNGKPVPSSDAPLPFANPSRRQTHSPD